MEHQKEDETDGIIEIDGRRIEGWIDEKPCPTCSKATAYYDRFDAFFCDYCNNWLDSNCGDSTCEYCKNRPDKPLT